MLRWRLTLGMLFGFGIAGLCWLDANSPIPGAWLAPLAVLIAVLGAVELFNMLAERDIWPARAPVLVGLVATVLAPWLGPFQFAPARGLDVAFAALVLAMMAVFIVEMARYRAPGEVSERLGGAALVLVYMGGLMAFIVALRINFEIGALASLILVTKMGDIGAYAIGRLFGRRKLIPRLSPGKTWEGVFGAIVFACVGAWISTTYLTEGQGGWGWILYGPLVGVAGVLGDLAESLIKRDLGRKDSSNWMPGFGGVLDLLDSILFAAPVAYLCWRFGLMGAGLIVGR